MKRILILLCLPLLFTTCKKEEDDNTPTNNTNLAIGDSYQGGIIFYIDSSGAHGLITTINDHGPSEWGCPQSTIWSTSNALGTGQANTTAILDGCSTIGIAAKLCDDYTITTNGVTYDDWFLPSLNELYQMYLNIGNNGSFNNDPYWSSTEAPIDYVHTQYFDGSQYENWKGNNLHFRPIRAF